MPRGYQTDKLKVQIVDLLRQSKTGLSGVEISKKIGINRVTMAKYLGVFAAEGLINQKNTGNITIWFVDDDIEQFSFPDDYFVVQKKYLDLLTTFSQKPTLRLIRNCMNSEAVILRMLIDVITPAVHAVNDLFDAGKIGTAEENLLRSMISESVKALDAGPHLAVPEKNVIIMSADADSHLISDAALALYRSKNWTVFPLGNMASTADVLFDLDLQKLLSKIWKNKTGVMLVAVFSNSEQNLNFFAESLNTVKKKHRRLFSVLCGPVSQKATLDADLVTSDLGALIQWSETVSESHTK